MPLTPFQREVARTLAKNRNPDSLVAGGAVINRGEAGLRFSDDIDIFHETAEAVALSAEADEKALRDSGYAVIWTARRDGLFRAEVSREAGRLRLDWTTDSAFRFFPAQADDEFGYCLHRADLATNKVLALAGRNEIRDFLDILQLDHDYLSLGTMMWGACGKDPGVTPDLLLQLTNRHSRYQESELRTENLARNVDLKQLKLQWLSARDRAEALFERLPPEDLGCLYLGPTHVPVTPDPDNQDFPALIRHFGCIRGAWPQIS
jgi:hypothetical protein